MQTSDTAVFCRDITKDFGTGNNRTIVLRGIDLEIPFGEMTLLVGPSGCGKTTLISVIVGLLDATAGELSVLGEDLRAFRGGEAVRFRRANLGFAIPAIQSSARTDGGGECSCSSSRRGRAA